MDEHVNNPDKHAKIFPQVKPVEDLQTLSLVQVTAKHDNHDVHFPTHYVEKNGEIIGSFNVGPIVMLWMHKTRSNAADSSYVLSVMQTLLMSSRVKNFILMCGSESDFMPYMEKCGFVKGRQFTFFRKEL
jgi:hypothetical protein